MRTATAAVAVSVLAATVGSALALQPCPDSCHLGQGQPLFLEDAKVLLTTRCDRVGGKTNAAATCVTEQLELDGKVQLQLPRKPSSVGIDHDFTKTYLEGHTLIGLGWQSPWKDLGKPYALEPLFTHQQLTLSLAKSVLTCTAPGRPVLTRDFGCVPSEVHVFATLGLGHPQHRPVVAIAVCRPDTHTEHEVVVVCAASESNPTPPARARTAPDQ